MLTSHDLLAAGYVPPPHHHNKYNLSYHVEFTVQHHFFYSNRRIFCQTILKFHHVFEYCLFCLGLRTADFMLSICQVAFITVHRDILSLGLLQSLWHYRACFHHCKYALNDSIHVEGVTPCFAFSSFHA